MSLLWWTDRWNWELRWVFASLSFIGSWCFITARERKQRKLLWYLSCLYFFNYLPISCLSKPRSSPKYWVVPQCPPNGPTKCKQSLFGVLVPCEYRCFKLTFTTNDHSLRQAVTQARVMVQPEVTVEIGQTYPWISFLFISLIFTDFWYPIAGTSRQQEFKTAGHITSIVWNRQKWIHACLLTSLCSALYTRYMWYRIKFWWMLRFGYDICSLIGPEIHSLTPLNPIITNVLSM